MKKMFLIVLAVGISNATTLPTARTADADGGKAVQSYAADYPRARRAYTRVSAAYPYYRGFDRVADPWWPGSGFCAYGSHVACVYSQAFCWQRCY